MGELELDRQVRDMIEGTNLTTGRKRRGSGNPVTYKRVLPQSTKAHPVAQYGIDVGKAASELDDAGDGLFALKALSSGTAIPYGGEQVKIYASSVDALRAGAPVSHLHTLLVTRQCMDATPGPGVPPGGAEFANQPLDGRKCKLNHSHTIEGYHHCSILTKDVAEGEEIFADYGSDGRSFLGSVGFFKVSDDYKITQSVRDDYADHWLYKQYKRGKLPAGAVLARMNALFPTQM